MQMVLCPLLIADSRILGLMIKNYLLFQNNRTIILPVNTRGRTTSELADVGPKLVAWRPKCLIFNTFCSLIWFLEL